MTPPMTQIARHGLVLACLFVVAGCPTLDVSQPIALLPEPIWIESERQTLSEAAECWNNAFGTRMSVGASEGIWQQVQFRYSDFVCIYAGARTEPTLPVQVSICPHGLALSSMTLYDVLLHELGHVVNIRPHADDPDAVMSTDLPANKHAFTEEDCRLFREANPEFEPAPPPFSPLIGCRCPAGAGP